MKHVSIVLQNLRAKAKRQEANWQITLEQLDELNQLVETQQLEQLDIQDVIEPAKKAASK